MVHCNNDSETDSDNSERHEKPKDLADEECPNVGQGSSLIPCPNVGHYPNVVHNSSLIPSPNIEHKSEQVTQSMKDKNRFSNHEPQDVASENSDE